MPERGGATTQDGVYYQNTVAARYLADLLDLAQLPPRERVVEVRVEAPSDVDDIVVRFSDGHRDWLQAKLGVQSSGNAWNSLWSDLAAQSASPEFRAEDRLVIVLGEHDRTARTLRDLCERSVTASGEVEWHDRLGGGHRKLLQAITRALGSSTAPLELLRRTTVEIEPLQEIERSFERRRLGVAFALPPHFLSVLRDIAGGGARRRALFLAAPLRKRLWIEFKIEIDEPAEWGLPAYRSTVERLARIEIPGTGISGPSHDLFVWPRARDYERANSSALEDEETNWTAAVETSTVDLQCFPSEILDRCIVIAGPGYGKSALLGAVAAQLARTPYVPVLIPLASFAASGLSVLEFLTTEVNRELEVRADWLRLAEQGLVVLLLDGFDEIPTVQRQRVLGRIATFSARHPSVPWLLTVRDPAVLSGPADARLIELLPLEWSDIFRFAEAMKSRVPGLDVWKFERRLSAYPELVRLARIPLFLVMMMALANDAAVLPSSRADLIEAYLKTLFSPHEHKPLADAEIETLKLRRVAEALAFERLERQEIGATEREVQGIAARVDADAGSPEALLTRLLRNGVLRRQSAIRLQFPYPIVQEYLAACFLVRERPETLIQRVDEAINRPWAQVVQFALELHPSPTSLIASMLERKDDAFATGLRLIGRCVANGANVDPSVKREITRRLTSAWVHASLHNRERVGRLIVDGFSTPLPPEVRAVLGLSWLIDFGAGEIVTRENDPELTMEVLTALLDRGIEVGSGFSTLQPALNLLADEVFKKYCEKARRPGTTEEELSGLTYLLGGLDPARLAPGISLDLAFDEALPDRLRLEAFRLAAPPLHDRAWPIVRRVLDSYAYGAAVSAIGRTVDPEQTVLELLHDTTLGMEQRRCLIYSPMVLFRDPERRHAFIRRCVVDETLTPELRDILQVFAARYGDREAFQGLVNRLATLELRIAEATVALLGHHPSRDLGVQAAEAAGSRVTSGREAVRFAQHVVTGVTTIFEMDYFQSGSLPPSPAHPSLDVWAELVETWIAQFDFTEVERFRILTAGSQLGSVRATSVLERLIRELSDPDDTRYDEEDEYGHYVRAALHELRLKRRLLPLEVGECFARASRANLAYAGIEAIAAHADRPALDLLLRLQDGSSEWGFRSTLSFAIETLAGRLGLCIIIDPGETLTVSSWSVQ
jgi:hypothetical protein